MPLFTLASLIAVTAKQWSAISIIIQRSVFAFLKQLLKSRGGNEFDVYLFKKCSTEKHQAIYDTVIRS